MNKKAFVGCIAALWSVVAVAQSPFGDPVELPRAPVAVRTAPQASSYSVTRDDKSVREVLARWTSQSGWTFRTEHWTVGSDIPVSGYADLGPDFKVAVRALLASTRLTELPVKPCFYTNQVVRVIPRNEKCDKTKD